LLIGNVLDISQNLSRRRCLKSLFLSEPQVRLVSSAFLKPQKPTLEPNFSDLSTLVLPTRPRKSQKNIFRDPIDEISDVLLRFKGDGNCLLHALSRAVWGTEIYCDVLRAKMFEELQQHHDWYKANSKYEEKEFETAVAFAGQPGAHLSFLHVLALANLIKRPITIYAGDEDIERFGTGEVRFLHFPTSLREISQFKRQNTH
jgi:hypothetical protein